MARLSFLFFATLCWCSLMPVSSASSTSNSTFSCSNDNVVAQQASSDTQQVNANGCACFSDGVELRNAVKEFINEGCSDSNKCYNGTAQTYGWPMGSWCVSNVTSMYGLFWDEYAFNDDISSWDVSSVTNMWGLFWNASSFNQDLSSWDVSSVVSMHGMFYQASSFNGDLTSWDVSAVNDMSQMFWGGSSFNQDLCSWRTKMQVTVFGLAEMFSNSGCSYTSEPNLEGGPFCGSDCTDVSEAPSLTVARPTSFPTLVINVTPPPIVSPTTPSPAIPTNPPTLDESSTSTPTVYPAILLLLLASYHLMY
mmetsp:Transcript_2685/g.6292  ORF Transcript_2685/g.6292 Transcript_2685/m.6292 type:complete len:308 (-) Transcript_2685:28-951(-)